MNPSNIRVVNLLPSALAVLGVILALYFFSQVSASLMAVTLAVLLASALNPVVLFFERWMPRGFAALFSVLLLATVARVHCVHAPRDGERRVDDLLLGVHVPAVVGAGLQDRVVASDGVQGVAHHVEHDDIALRCL